MIRIENLNLGYSGGFNLTIDSLEVKKGEIKAIIGPNGAGKTTLLNVLAMFEKPKTGTIHIFGKSILDYKNALFLRRQMSFVFSQPYLLNGNVYDNIALPLRLRSVNNLDSIDEMISLFKIEHLKSRNVVKLSQGEKYRVALARAFVTKPKLIFFDEPFLSLDQRYKQSLISQLHEILKKYEVTALFVSQDHFEVLSLADSIALMKEGRILQEGRPQDIFSKPASKAVADFVGIETIIEGLIVKKEDNLCFVQVGNVFVEVVSEYDKGDSVFVCIRPEDVFISTRVIESSSIRNHFRGRIDSIMPWGLQQKLIIDCGFMLVVFVTRQSLEHMQLKAGDEIYASCKATAIHLIKR